MRRPVRSSLQIASRALALGLVAVLAALVLAACSAGSGPDRMTIAVIPKGTSHVFWQSIHAGALQAGSELGVEIGYRGPLREDDRDSQIAEVEKAGRRGISGTVFARSKCGAVER